MAAIRNDVASCVLSAGFSRQNRDVSFRRGLLNSAAEWFARFAAKSHFIATKPFKNITTIRKPQERLRKIGIGTRLGGLR